MLGSSTKAAGDTGSRRAGKGNLRDGREWADQRQPAMTCSSGAETMSGDRERTSPPGVDPRLRTALLAAASVGVLWGLRWAQSVIIPVLVAALIATLAEPVVSWLQRHWVPRPGAVIVVVLGLLVLLLGVPALLAGSVDRFTSQAPHYEARIRAMVDSSMDGLEWIGVDTEPLKGGGTFSPSAVIGFLADNLKALGRCLSSLFTALLILVAMLLEVPAVTPKLVSILPASSNVVERAAEVTAQVRRHFGVKTVVSLATGISVAALTALIGLEFPLVWGLIAYLLNYIPVIGSLAAALPAILLALVQSGIGMAALVAVAYLGVNVLFGNVIEPLLMGRTLGLSTLAVFLSVVFWGWLWGPAGALLSALLTIVVKSACERIPGLEWFAVVLGPPPSEDGAQTP